MKLILFACFVFLLEIYLVSSSTWYISPDGNDTSGTGTLASPFLTLQKAVASSNAGDTIMILAGVYAGPQNLVTINTSVSLIAFGNVYFHCANNSDGLVINASCTINGITIAACYSGVRVIGSPSYVNIQNSLFMNHQASALSVVSSANVSVNITSSKFFGNWLGLLVQIGNSSSVQITDSTFTNGGVWVAEMYDSNVWIKNSDISGCSSTWTYGGGGITVEVSTGSVFIDNSTVRNNKAVQNGGGLHISGANVVITNTNITGNSAIYGGGFYADSGTTVKGFGLTIANNTATTGSAYACVAGNVVSLTNSTVESNSGASTCQSSYSM